MEKLKFIFVGFYFGFILLKSEAISWFRIIEMFHFQSFHMYGVIGSAVLTGIVSIQLIKKINIKTINGKEVCFSEKPIRYKANLIGGIIFGLGWGLVGACTAPLFIHLGLGNTIIVIPIIGSFIGVLIYSLIKNKIPH